MFKLKFGVLPGHWGLKGKTREIAKAEYELEGYELDRKLLEIHKDEYEEEFYEKKVLALDRQYNHITEIEYNRALLKYLPDKKEAELKALELDKIENLISDNEYDKRVATVKGEPWVNVVEVEFDANKSNEGSFELDWNDHFINILKGNGYHGHTDEDMVSLWFTEMCKNIALQTYDGVGTFTEDANDNIDGMKERHVEVLKASGRSVHH